MPANDDTLPLDENIQETQPAYNMPIYGIKGTISLSANVSVPYFSALLDLKRITGELKTHEETAPSLENVYTLTELFQREINGDRVQHEIVDGFLRAPDKIKFFNSLTIVLLPKDKNGKILELFPNTTDDKLKFEDDAFDRSFARDTIKHSLFGGVQFSVAKSADIARLRWDTKRIDAVAVDGQHRLKALKLWMQSRNNEVTEVERPTRISVLFLLLHQSAGFSSTSSTNSIKTIAREIFTDLNKNAKEVDLATQIILDDRNLESCCVRSLITPRTGQSSDKQLPLSLLRWREANNRFDNSWYLNSLVNLHLIVEDVIGLSLPAEPMDSGKVQNYIGKLEAALGKRDAQGSKTLQVNGKSLKDHYRENYFDLAEGDNTDTPVAPFSAIPSSYLKEAVNGFQENYATWLLKLLREFKPYKTILDYADTNGIVEGEFAKFLAQPKTAREQLIKELEQKYGDSWYDTVVGRHELAIQAVKSYRDTALGEQWAFKTLFQKAFVRLGKQIELGLTNPERESIGTNIDDMLTFFNRLYDANLLRIYSPISGISHSLWTSIAVNPGNRKIRVNAQTEARIEALLRLWYFGYRYLVVNKIDTNLEDWAKTTFGGISPKSAHSIWLCSDDAQSLLALFSENAISLEPTKFSTALTQEAQADVSRKVARTRLVAILEAGWAAHISPQAPHNLAPAPTPREDDSMI